MPVVRRLIYNLQQHTHTTQAQKKVKSAPGLFLVGIPKGCRTPRTPHEKKKMNTATKTCPSRIHSRSRSITTRFQLRLCLNYSKLRSLRGNPSCVVEFTTHFCKKLLRRRRKARHNEGKNMVWVSIEYMGCSDRRVSP